MKAENHMVEAQVLALFNCLRNFFVRNARRAPRHIASGVGRWKEGRELPSLVAGGWDLGSKGQPPKEETHCTTS
jgi:hypothetical protein